MPDVPTTRLLVQMNLFGGPATQIVDVPVPPPEPEAEPLEVVPVLEGQLDLLNARAVRLRPVMDLLAAGRVDEASAAARRIRGEDELATDLMLLHAELAGLAPHALAVRRAVPAALDLRIRAATPAGIAVSLERGLAARVAAALEEGAPGHAIDARLAGQWWLLAERDDLARAAFRRDAAVPAVAALARLELGTLLDDPKLVVEALVIDPAATLERARQRADVDAALLLAEELELEPVAEWIAACGVAAGSWQAAPLIEELPHLRERVAADDFAAHLRRAADARLAGRTDLDARRALARLANGLFRALLGRGLV